jgi:hypothetical protein
LRAHCHQLLPDWSVQIQSTLIILQRCQLDLIEHNPDTEVQKRHLRQSFLTFGLQIAFYLKNLNLKTEVFDPRTGQPVLSMPGSMALSDVAIAQAMLGYPTIQSGRCSILVHPQWGSAVYPSTLVSSASPAQLSAVVRRFVECRVYHQSLSD